MVRVASSTPKIANRIVTVGVPFKGESENAPSLVDQTRSAVSENPNTLHPLTISTPRRTAAAPTRSSYRKYSAAEGEASTNASWVCHDSGMTISVEDRRLYGADWGHLSWNIVVRRAGGRCECLGHCGGVNQHLDPVDGRCRNRHGEPRWRGNPWQRPVILSTAHLDHNPETRDPDLLIGLCESCHLRYDARQHWSTRRRRHEEAAGLLPLF